MRVYRLTSDLAFPPPSKADETGLLAVGGDLRPERLLLAYRLGIFPWFSHGDPILWWSPHPRLILPLKQLHVPKRLEKTVRQGRFEITWDRAFGRVIRSCAHIPRAKQRGTWITREMIEAYQRLHELGYAHSLECWREGQLAGGIYGISLGRAFFGESMFRVERDASKVALVSLARCLAGWGFDFVDCQVASDHLLQFGAREVGREEFLGMLEESSSHPTCVGSWDRVDQGT